MLCLYKLIALSLAFFSHHIFSSAYDTRGQYDGILPHSTLLTVLLCLGGYYQCCTQLWKVLHKFCNTDMLRVLLIYPHSLQRYTPSGVVCIIHQSNPSLPCYNILMYTLIIKTCNLPPLYKPTIFYQLIAMVFIVAALG